MTTENKATQKCEKCKVEQELIEGVSMKEDNIYQDDSGKYLFCKKCKHLTATEI